MTTVMQKASTTTPVGVTVRSPPGRRAAQSHDA